MINKIKKMVKYFDSEYTFKSCEEWDKCGLMYGDPLKSVEVVAVALDLTKEVFDIALRKKASLIITHHPFIFESEEEDIAKYPYKKELLHRIKNTGMSVISLHTCYDNSIDGMSSYIANKLKFKIINQNKYGVMMDAQNQSLDFISNLLEEKLDSPISSSNINDESKFKKIALIPGSGSIEDILEYHKQGANLVITSDIKWSTWVAANEENIQLAQVSHGIESVFVEDIANKIMKHFKNIKVISL